MNQQIRKVNSNIEKEIGFINQYYTPIFTLKEGCWWVEFIDNFQGLKRKLRVGKLSNYCYENSTVISE